MHDMTTNDNVEDARRIGWREADKLLNRVSGREQANGNVSRCSQLSASYNVRRAHLSFESRVPRIIFSCDAHEYRRARVSRSLHRENVVSMTTEYRFDDLDLREEPARFEADPDLFSDSVTTVPKSDACSASCMTCYGARW